MRPTGSPRSSTARAVHDGHAAGKASTRRPKASGCSVPDLLLKSQTPVTRAPSQSVHAQFVAGLRMPQRASALRVISHAGIDPARTVCRGFLLRRTAGLGLRGSPSGTHVAWKACTRGGAKSPPLARSGPPRAARGPPRWTTSATARMSKRVMRLHRSLLQIDFDRVRCAG